MLIQENVTVYKCEFCKKKYFQKPACEKHEELCFHNPINKRPCFSCDHCEKKKVTAIIDHGYMNHQAETQVEILFCNHFKEGIYPPKVSEKGNSLDLGEFDNVPMPKDCDFYKDTLTF